MESPKKPNTVTWIKDRIKWPNSLIPLLFITQVIIIIALIYVATKVYQIEEQARYERMWVHNALSSEIESMNSKDEWNQQDIDKIIYKLDEIYNEATDIHMSILDL